MKKYTIIAAAVLALCMAFCFICKPVYYRLYPGDRIRGNIQVIVDGQPCTLTESSFTDCRRADPEDDGSANIRIRAGKYGSYAFEMHVAALEAPVTVRCFQHNWWNVTDFDLQFQIDTKQNTAAVSGSVTTIADNGKKVSDSIRQEYDLTEPVQVSFGL